mgnify:CR=1 FL=1
MKAGIILFCALVVLCRNAFAQDIIHTIDGRSIEAKVIEINDNDILYKTFDNLDGPNYRAFLRDRGIISANLLHLRHKRHIILICGGSAWSLSAHLSMMAR